MVFLSNVSYYEIVDASPLNCKQMSFFVWPKTVFSRSSKMSKSLIISCCKLKGLTF